MAKNALTTTNQNANLPATEGDEPPNFFQIYGESVMPSQIVGSLLVFTKFGEYKAGQEKSDVPHGTRLMFNMNSFKHGWMKWEDNKPIEIKMGYLSDGFVPPARETLGDTDEESWGVFDDGRPKDPWQRANNVIAMDFDSGELYTFSSGSKGGMSALGELAKAYGDRMKAHPTEMPVVELGMREYKHSNPAYGMIRTPKFNLIGWSEPPAGLVDASPEDPTDAPAELPPPKAAPKKLAPASVAAKAKAGVTVIPPKGGARIAPKAAPSQANKPAGKPIPARGKGAGTKGVRFG